jgi:hypothetical protein
MSGNSHLEPGRRARVYTFTRRLNPGSSVPLTFVVPTHQSSSTALCGVSWQEFNHLVSARVYRIALDSTEGSASLAAPSIATLEVESFTSPSNIVQRFSVATVSDGRGDDDHLIAAGNARRTPTPGLSTTASPWPRHSREATLNLRLACDGYTKLRCVGNAPLIVCGEVHVGLLHENDDYGEDEGFDFLDDLDFAEAAESGGVGGSQNAARADGNDSQAMLRNLLERLMNSTQRRR